MSSNEKKSVRLSSGQTAEPFTGEAADKYMQEWKGHTNGMVRIQPLGMLMPTIFPTFHDRIMKYKFGPKDVLVMTYPKCGTTWTQEVVWTMRNNPDLDNPDAAAPIHIRCPFIEFDTLSDSDNMPKLGPENPVMQAFNKLCPNADPRDGVYLQMSESIPDPRTIKTHLPFSLLPADILDNAKVVYVLRNPKDLMVSFLHHCRLIKIHNYTGDMENFVDTFIRGDMFYGHYDLHLKEALARQGHKNVLILHFEDMKADPKKQIARLDAFLNTQLNDQQIAKVVEYTSFAEMKKRDNMAGPSDDEGGIFNVQVAKKDGGFFRKGETGNWKEKLNEELSKKIDSWSKEKLGDSGLTFTYSS